MFPQYVVKCPVCGSETAIPYNPKYAEEASRAPGGLYYITARCPRGHAFEVGIDEFGVVRRIYESHPAAEAKDCELVGSIDFLPPAVRQKVAEALRTGDYRGVEKLVEDLKRAGLIKCL